MDGASLEPARQRINGLITASALIAGLTAAIHVLAGGPKVNPSLLQPNVPPFTDEVRILLLACWHLVSVSLAFSAIALARAAMPREAASSRSLVRFISALWLGFAAVFLVVAFWHGGVPWLLKLPQWILLAPVGVLGLLGSRGDSGSARLRTGS